MNVRHVFRVLAVLTASWAATACVPIPVHLYAADPAQGKLLFSACAINRNVPDGIELRVEGVSAQVKLRQAFSPRFVEVRIDVPPGRRVQLQSDVVSIDRHDGRPAVEARYPNISLVDSPGIHSFDTPPALVQYMVPVQTPMVGGAMTAGTRRMESQHFWMAARVDTQGARDVTVTLPNMLIDDIPARFPILEFHSSLSVVLAPLNC